jgi:hypothetical protein
VASGYRGIVAAVERQDAAATLRLAYLVAGIIYNLTEAAFKKQHPVGIFLLLAVIAIPRLHVAKADDVPSGEDQETSGSTLQWPHPSSYLES